MPSPNKHHVHGVRVLEIAPGHHLPDVPPELLPRVAYVILRPAKVTLDCGRRVTAMLPSMETAENWLPMGKLIELPLGVDRKVAEKLALGGFVESQLIAPQTERRVNVRSLVEHMGRVREDPDFWRCAKNLLRYKYGVKNSRMATTYTARVERVEDNGDALLRVEGSRQMVVLPLSRLPQEDGPPAQCGQRLRVDISWLEEHELNTEAPNARRREAAKTQANKGGRPRMKNAQDQTRRAQD